MAKVHLDSVLAEFVPGRHLSIRAESLGALLDDLERRYPKLRFRIRDETGALRRFIKLFVNGTEAVGPDLAGTALGPADEVDVIHSVQGG